jgi:hypothetical protein
VKTADDIRTDAIALLVEKLRKIGAEADRQCKQHREAEKSPGALADFHIFSDHREHAALNYALAYRCEQLIEEITGALLFDELDAQDDAAEQTARDADDDDEPWDECPDQFYAPTIIESYVRHAIEGQAGQ